MDVVEPPVIAQRSIRIWTLRSEEALFYTTLADLGQVTSTGKLYASSGCRCNYTWLAQARLTSLSLYVMYAQAVQNVSPAESTARHSSEDK